MSTEKKLIDEFLENSDSFQALFAHVKQLEEKITDLETREQIPIEEKEFYTFNDIVNEFPMSKKTFYKYKKLYNLSPAFKRNRTLFYKKSDVIDFIKDSGNTTGAIFSLISA